MRVSRTNRPIGTPSCDVSRRRADAEGRPLHQRGQGGPSGGRHRAPANPHTSLTGHRCGARRPAAADRCRGEPTAGASLHVRDRPAMTSRYSRSYRPTISARRELGLHVRTARRAVQPAHPTAVRRPPRRRRRTGSRSCRRRRSRARRRWGTQMTGRPTDHGLDHDEPERLRPRDRVEQSHSAPELAVALVRADLPEELDVAPQPGPHEPLEVLALGGLAHLGRQAQRHPRPSGRSRAPPRRPSPAPAGRGTSRTRPHRRPRGSGRGVETVVDHRGERHSGCRGPLVVGDGDVARPPARSAYSGVLSTFSAPWQVTTTGQGGRSPLAHIGPSRRVVVDDLAVDQVVVGRPHLHGLVQGQAHRFRGRLEDPAPRHRAGRVADGEQPHLVAVGEQATSQGVEEALGAAVRRRRHGTKGGATSPTRSGAPRRSDPSGPSAPPEGAPRVRRRRSAVITASRLACLSSRG